MLQVCRAKTISKLQVFAGICGYTKTISKTQKPDGSFRISCSHSHFVQISSVTAPDTATTPLIYMALRHIWYTIWYRPTPKTQREAGRQRGDFSNGIYRYTPSHFSSKTKSVVTTYKDTLLTALLTVLLQPTIDISPRHTDISKFCIAHSVQYLGGLVHPTMTTSTLNNTISLTEHSS